MVDRVSHGLWLAGESLALLALLAVLTSPASQIFVWRFEIMADEKTQKPAPVRLTAKEVGVVNCPTTSQTKTVDGKVHEMTRAYPLLILPNGKNDQKSYGQALTQWLDMATRIGNGAEIHIIDAESNEVVKVAIPTDDVPPAQDERVDKSKDDDGKDIETTIVNHGVNFPITLPVDFAEMVNLFNTGLKGSVYRTGSNDIITEFRVGGGKRGRQAAAFDPTKLA